MQGYQKQIHHFVEQKTIVVQLVEHHSEARIALYFKNTAELNTLVRAIPGAKNPEVPLNVNVPVVPEPPFPGDSPILSPTYRDWETDRKSTRLNSSP